MQKLKINNESIIFLDSDKENGFETIAYNWNEDTIFLISANEYHLLQNIFRTGYTDEIDKITEDLIRKGILIPDSGGVSYRKRIGVI